MSNVEPSIHTAEPPGMPGDRMLVTGFTGLTLERRDAASSEACYVDGLGEELRSRKSDRTRPGASARWRRGLWPNRQGVRLPQGPHVHFAFSVTPGRLEALVEHLAAAASRPEEREGDRSLYVRDPEDNVVEVWDSSRSGRTMSIASGGRHARDGTRRHREVLQASGADDGYLYGDHERLA